MSQKRGHLALFCISILWQRGTHPQKKNILLSQKKPSSGILHQSNCNRLLWLHPNSRPDEVLDQWVRQYFVFYFLFVAISSYLGPEIISEVLESILHRHFLIHTISIRFIQKLIRVQIIILCILNRNIYWSFCLEIFKKGAHSACISLWIPNRQAISTENGFIFKKIN